MPYQPGQHIIAELAVSNLSLLTSYEQVKNCIDELIKQFELVNLGEVYHNFSPQGFTVVVCLSESHISLHSWPEYNRLNMDIYLSNYLKDNTSITENIFDALVRFFSAGVINRKTLLR